MQRQSRQGTALPGSEKAFGRILQQMRSEKGISQEQLGFESGYHPTYIGLLERGKRNPTLRAILGLAAVLRVPASEIVRRVEAHLSDARKASRGAGERNR